MSELNEQDRAELVAYLDGELEEKAAQAFEARLSRDHGLRAEAEALRKTWEMLDYLPRAELSASFTHRTLERLAVPNLGGQKAPGRSHLWRWAVAAGWAAAVVMAIGAGVFAAYHLWPAPAPVPPPQPQANQQIETETLIARDLEVIRNKRLYENADNIDFVRALPQVFDEEEDES
jgi:anti-sigma factor RsiW